jgi:hypothetical protein
MTRADVQLRARHATDFLETATDALTLHPERTNVAISNAVLAGIAAADAICGRTLGQAAKGDAHDEAARLLGTTGPEAAQQVNDLRRLLALKTNSQYSPLVLTDSTAADAIRWASRLIESMRTVLAGP